MPVISVIIPTYNRFEFLHRAIQSVLRQTFHDIEIIVIDDCSTDPRYKGLDAYYALESRVKIIHLEQNMRAKHNSTHAQGMTRNEGIKIATGDYIAFLDDDDFYCDPKKLEYQIDLIASHPDCKLCCSNAIKGHGLDMKSYNQLYFYNTFGKPLQDNPFVGSFKLDRELILQTNYIMNSSVLISRDIVEKAGYQKIVVYEDWEYWKTCLNYTNAIYTSKPLLGYDMGHGFGKQYD